MIDEVQNVPALLDEVRRLIETAGRRFVLYGERGIRAFEVKRSSSVHSQDLSGLRVR